MNNVDQILGLVKEGQFEIIFPESESGTNVKLTEDFMGVGRDIKELNLKEYEGKVVMTKGYYSGDWIYSAEIIDQAGPILSLLIKKVFNK